MYVHDFILHTLNSILYPPNILLHVQLHTDHPYPTKKEKEDLARKTGMGLKQIMHWMSNVRKRRFLPLIRLVAMYI